MAQEELFLPPPPLMPRLSTADRVGGALPLFWFLFSLPFFKPTICVEVKAEGVIPVHANSFAMGQGKTKMQVLCKFSCLFSLNPLVSTLKSHLAQLSQNSPFQNNYMAIRTDNRKQMAPIIFTPLTL